MNLWHFYNVLHCQHFKVDQVDLRQRTEKLLGNYSPLSPETHSTTTIPSQGDRKYQQKWQLLYPREFRLSDHKAARGSEFANEPN